MSSICWLCHHRMAALEAISSAETRTMGSHVWLTIVLVSVLLIASSAAILWWQSKQILDNYTTIREQKSTQAMLSERNSGVQLSTCGDQRRRCVRVNPEAGTFGDDSSWMILAGK